MENIFEVILIMGFAWAISGLLKIIIKREKTLISLTEVFVIIIFLFTILDNLLRPSFIDMRLLRFIYPFTRLSYFLVGPTLYWYLMSLVNKDFKFTKKSLPHLIPFVIWFIYVLFDPSSLNPKVLYNAVRDNTNDIIEPLFNFSFLWDITLNTSRVIYSVYMVIIVRRYKDVIEDEYSTKDNKNNLSWFTTLITLYTFFFIVNSAMHLFLAEGNVIYQNFSAFIRSVPAVLFVFFFTLYSEIQPKLVKVEKEIIQRVETEDRKIKKYKKSGLSERECESIYNEICERMESEKYYLDSSLTLNSLAEKIGISRHKISEAINTVAEERFFKFINTYRLKEFVEAIKTNKYPNFTLLAISLECGFKSSSSFYSIVKEEYGVTPKVLVNQISS